MAPTDAIPNLPVSPAPQTPPSSPKLRPHKRELDSEQVQLLTDLLKAVQAIQSIPAAAGADQPATMSSQSEKPRERASRLEFKSVLERWVYPSYLHLRKLNPVQDGIPKHTSIKSKSLPPMKISASSINTSSSSGFVLVSLSNVQGCLRSNSIRQG